MTASKEEFLNTTMGKLIGLQNQSAYWVDPIVKGSHQAETRYEEV